MSSPTEQLQAEYRRLTASTGGQHLITWMNGQIAELHRQAHKKAPPEAWGDLQKAQGIQSVLDNLALMVDIDDIGKHNNKRHSPIR